jgi:hypothetical protein
MSMEGDGTDLVCSRADFDIRGSSTFGFCCPELYTH